MSDPAPDGLIVVDKPNGWTSHDVVARVRGLAGTRKVGHAGTLDPMATGVLLLGIGRATRLLGHLALASKSYTATVRLGQSTVTDDAEGEVVATSDASGVTTQAVDRAAEPLRGDILQVPSSVSAIKIDGERAYRRVRAGQDVAIPARPVHIAALTIAEVRAVGSCLDVDIRVDCSTGTYVRALARDLGAALEVGGHLTTLRRTRVGSFTLDEAHTLEALAEPEAGELPVIPLDAVAQRQFAWYVVADDAVTAVRNGRALTARLRQTPEAPEGPEGPVGAEAAKAAVDAEAAKAAVDAAVDAEAGGTRPNDLAEPDTDENRVHRDDGPPTAYQPGERGAGPEGPVAVLAPGGQFLALYEQHGPIAKAVAVFAPA